MAFYTDYFMDTFKGFEHLFEGEGFRVEKYNEGQILSTGNDKEGIVYYLVSGRVVLNCSNSEGKTYTILRMPKGNLIPFNYLTSEFFDLSSSMNIQALSDIRVIAFSMKTFKDIITKESGFSLACLEYSARINNLLQYELMALAVMDSKKRIYECIYFLHKYGRRLEGDIINFTQEEIAQEIGITRIQLGRVLKELREEGIITTKRNGLLVEDIERLKTKIK